MTYPKASAKSASTPDQPCWFQHDWLWGIALMVGVILTYFPVWWAGFVWDDDIMLTANPVVAEPFGLKEIWTTTAADICPLTITTFWLEYKLFGLQPWPYHLVNALLQGACAIVLWQVLRKLQIPGAWLGAAMWALHPLQVESTAWIAEMKNTESGLFYLLTILFFLKWLTTKPGDQKGRSWNYGLTLLFAVMAMASKSSTVILPVVLCLCAWWMEGRWHWRNAVKVAPIFLISIATGLASLWTQGERLALVTDPQWARSWPMRLAAAGDAAWFYLGKILWPHPLMAIYPRWKIETGQLTSYFPLLAAILILFYLWLKRETWMRPWFFAYAYFLVALFPGLGLINNAIFMYSLVFDHFQYLASMGVLALVGAGMVWLGNLVIPQKPWLQAGLGAGVLLVLGALSWQRAWAYESEETLWTDAIAQNPDCWVGYNNLGNAFLNKGDTDEAIAQLQKSLEINPAYDIARTDLGQAFLKKGRVDEAMVQLQKAVELNPNQKVARNNLGLALTRKGKSGEALEQIQLALALDPNYADAHNNLGALLFQKGQADEAIAQFKMALALKPDYADAHYNLGVLLAQKGRTGEAVTHFQKALELNPNDVDTQKSLAKAMATQSGK